MDSNSSEHGHGHHGSITIIQDNRKLLHCLCVFLNDELSQIGKSLGRTITWPDPITKLINQAQTRENIGAYEHEAGAKPNKRARFRTENPSSVTSGNEDNGGVVTEKVACDDRITLNKLCLFLFQELSPIGAMLGREIRFPQEIIQFVSKVNRLEEKGPITGIADEITDQNDDVSVHSESSGSSVMDQYDRILGVDVTTIHSNGSSNEKLESKNPNIQEQYTAPSSSSSSTSITSNSKNKDTGSVCRNLKPSKLKPQSGKSGSSNICEICCKTLGSPSALKIHLKYHTGEHKYKCDTCSKQCPSRHHLDLHMRVHTRETPFSCLDCSKQFRTKGELTAHSRTHTGEKPFACIFCDKRYTTANGRDLHLQSHTGEKRFKCSKCEMHFRYPTQRKNHMKVHEESEWSTSENSDSD